MQNGDDRSRKLESSNSWWMWQAAQLGMKDEYAVWCFLPVGLLFVVVEDMSD
jgi:hypothetical protein